MARYGSIKWNIWFLYSPVSLTSGQFRSPNAIHLAIHSLTLLLSNYSTRKMHHLQRKWFAFHFDYFGRMCAELLKDWHRWKTGAPFNGLMRARRCLTFIMSAKQKVYTMKYDANWKILQFQWVARVWATIHVRFVSVFFFALCRAHLRSLIWCSYQQCWCWFNIVNSTIAIQRQLSKSIQAKWQLSILTRCKPVIHWWIDAFDSFVDLKHSTLCIRQLFILNGTAFTVERLKLMRKLDWFSIHQLLLN